MGTAAREIQFKLPAPHSPAQEEIILTNKNVVLFAGRRWGKTQAGVLRIITKSLQYGHTEDVPGLYWWVGLSWKSASMKRAWKLLQHYARRINRQFKQLHREGKISDSLAKRLIFDEKYLIRKVEKEVYFPWWNTQVWLRTAENPNSLAGEGVHGAVVDEVTLMPRRVWDEYLAQVLLDYGGWALLIGVPKGENWVAQLYREAKSGRSAKWIARHYTSYDNPLLDPAQIDALKANLSERMWRQEILAEILPDGAGVFRGLNEVANAKPIAKPNPTHIYVGGIDWGFSNDFTVFVILDVLGYDTARMVEMHRFTGMGFREQRRRIYNIAKKYGEALKVIVSEFNSIGNANTEDLQAMGLPVEPFTMSAPSKAEIIENLANAIENQRIVLLNDETLLDELRAYQAKRARGGLFQYSAPEGMHDDTVIATALAWHAVGYAKPILVF